MFDKTHMVIMMAALGADWALAAFWVRGYWSLSMPVLAISVVRDPLTAKEPHVWPKSIDSGGQPFRVKSISSSKALLQQAMADGATPLFLAELERYDTRAELTLRLRPLFPFSIAWLFLSSPWPILPYVVTVLLLLLILGHLREHRRNLTETLASQLDLGDTIEDGGADVED